MIVLIDNYDSFVYNLARYLQELGQPTHVVRNDRATLAELRALRPQAIILSPGPCTPSEAGISLDVVRELGREIPMLGVCLGHQVLAAATGGRIIRAPEPVHGRTSHIHHDGERLFAKHPNPFRATRYHSLIVEPATLPAQWRVTARTADGIIMAIEHRERPLFGVQFHPESVLTQGGHVLLQNFLALAGLNAGSLPPGDRDESPRTEPQPPQPLHW